MQLTVFYFKVSTSMLTVCCCPDVLMTGIGPPCAATGKSQHTVHSHISYSSRVFHLNGINQQYNSPCFYFSSPDFFSFLLFIVNGANNNNNNKEKNNSFGRRCENRDKCLDRVTNAASKESGVLSHFIPRSSTFSFRFFLLFQFCCFSSCGRCGQISLWANVIEAINI